MMDPELKKALDAMARTFTAPVWEGTSVWFWAWEYLGKEPPVRAPVIVPEYFEEDDGA